MLIVDAITAANKMRLTFDLYFSGVRAPAYYFDSIYAVDRDGGGYRIGALFFYDDSTDAWEGVHTQMEIEVDASGVIQSSQDFGHSFYRDPANERHQIIWTKV